MVIIHEVENGSYYMMYGESFGYGVVQPSLPSHICERAYFILLAQTFVHVSVFLRHARTATLRSGSTTAR